MGAALAHSRSAPRHQSTTKAVAARAPHAGGHRHVHAHARASPSLQSHSLNDNDNGRRQGGKAAEEKEEENSWIAIGTKKKRKTERTFQKKATVHVACSRKRKRTTFAQKGNRFFLCHQKYFLLLH